MKERSRFAVWWAMVGVIGLVSWVITAGGDSGACPSDLEPDRAYPLVPMREGDRIEMPPPRALPQVPLVENLEAVHGEPLRLRVVDEVSQAALTGCVVSQKLGMGWVRLGETDAAGRFSLEREAKEALTLGVVAADHQPRTVEVPADVEQWTLGLRVGSRLSGQVLRPWGGAAPEGVWVVAYPSGTDLQAPTGWGGPDGKGAHWATTGSHGAFAFTGLEPDQAWDLVAVAHGMYAPRAPHGVHTPAEDLRLTLADIHGVVIDWVEAGGGGLRCAESLRSVASSFPGSQGLRLFPGTRGLSPLGLDLDGLAGPGELLLYAGRVDRTEIGPLVIDARANGYAPVSTSVMLPRVRDGIPRMQLEMQSVAEGFGRLHVLMVGNASPASDPARVDRPVCALVLTRLGGDPDSRSQWFSPFRAWPTPGDRRLIDGVAEGLYRLELEADHQLFAVTVSSTLPDGAVEVSGDTWVECDLPPLGAIGVAATARNGEEYAGTAVVSLRRESDGAVGNVSFREAPFVVEGLPEGDYRVRLRAPLRASENGPWSDPVAVVPEQIDWIPMIIAGPR